MIPPEGERLRPLPQNLSSEEEVRKRVKRRVANILCWLALVPVGAALGGILGAFGDSALRFVVIVGGMFAGLALLMLAGKVLNDLTLRETLRNVGDAWLDVVRPAPAARSRESRREGRDGRRRRISWPWRIWLLACIASFGAALASLAAAAALPSGHWAAGAEAVFFTVGVLLLVVGWLVRLIQVWGRLAFVGWVGATAVSTAPGAWLESKIARSGWVAISVLSSIVLILGSVHVVLPG